MIDCPYCLGTGIGYGPTHCDLCGGRGYFEPTDDSYDYIINELHND